jgi:glycosyltransferase involved in cell wall biosynthesis
VWEKIIMKIAWIFPQASQCGITFYSRKYLTALSGLVDVACLDPADFITNKRFFIETIESCDLCHIQYETSFFLSHKKDFYSALCKAIKRPIVVTLHEIYERFPDIFPREEIAGNFIVKPVKKLLYDVRHPHATAFAHHLSRHFYADRLVVHAIFQKEILIKKGTDPQTIDVLPVPISHGGPKTEMGPASAEGVDLVATGFINPSYDFTKLFAVLALCDFPWKFTWVGGVRRPEDQGLLSTIKTEISKRGWEKRFLITGRVSDEARDEIITKATVYCAFFKYKSSSESLANAIGALAPIVCSDVPLFREMASEFPIMLFASDNPRDNAELIKKAAYDKNLRAGLISACENYSRQYSVGALSRQLVTIYERTIAG